MNRITKTAVAAVLVLTSAVAAGCSRDTASGGRGLKPVVRLATGVDPSFTPVYVASEKGFFAKHGVDVEYVTTEGGPTMTQAVIAGEAQVATQSDATTLTLMATNAGLRALVPFESSSTYINVVFGKGVKKPQDMKKLGAIPGVATLATVRYLESKGIKPDTVDLVEATPPDIPTLLKRGDIDATVIYEPWATRAAKESGGAVVGNIGDFGLSYSQWLVTDEKWFSANQDAAAGVAAAIEEANKYVTEHPEDAAAITEKAIKIPSAQTLAIMRDLRFVMRDFTDADLAQAKRSAEFFVQRGTIKSTPDIDTTVLRGFYTDHVGN